jgi:hypothetical protein
MGARLSIKNLPGREKSAATELAFFLVHDPDSVGGAVDGENDHDTSSLAPTCSWAVRR